jgi:hypothetical protein
VSDARKSRTSSVSADAIFNYKMTAVHADADAIAEERYDSMSLRRALY